MLKLFVFSICAVASFGLPLINNETVRKGLLRQEQERELKMGRWQACFTLVQAHFDGPEGATLFDFIEAHPTLSKRRLLEKVISSYMLQCATTATEFEVTSLLHYIDKPRETLDPTHF